MVGKAAMIAVLLAPTASIARHDDHSTDAIPVRWFNVAAPSARPLSHAQACPGLPPTSIFFGRRLFVKPMDCRVKPVQARQ
jgi:hypothetical protein